MKGEALQIRTQEFALRILKMAVKVPNSYSAQVMAQQITRSATSVGANYRAACRSKSRKDFANKLKMVEEELDETIYWLELIGDSGVFPKSRLKPLLDEGNELISIIVKSLKTVRANDEKARQPMKTL